MVLHLEGAEAVRPDLSNLEALYAGGIRSIGIVWSRPNAFGEGVPFRHPGHPDTGPGLTTAGRLLVDACNERGILVDVAHLNEKGFWDVATRSRAPIVCTHGAVHALCPSARNLTDRQLDAVGASGGVVGITLGVQDLRTDGRSDADTPLETVTRHYAYVAERIGTDRLAIGTDFDGATVPAAIGGADGLQRLIEALRARGFDAEEIRRIAWGNWFRILAATWR
jgi:membrane dipeptidase